MESKNNPIQDHFVVLCNQLNVESILPYLKEERMLTSEEYELLSGSNTSISTRQKRERLLIWMPRKGSNFFENFSKCLVWSGQAELARHIGVNVEAIPSYPKASGSSNAFSMMTNLISPGSGSMPPGMPAPPQSYYPHSEPTLIGRREALHPSYSHPEVLAEQRQPHPTQLPSTGSPKVFLLYFKDEEFSKYGLDTQTQVDTVLEMARILSRAGGFQLMVDMFETRDIQNWNGWTEDRILESRYVILLCSPGFRRVTNPSKGEVRLEMDKGAFFPSTIGQLISANKSIFIPVFLSQFQERSVIPANLMSSATYTLDVEGMLRTLEYTPNLQDLLPLQEFSDWERLIRQLRGTNFEQAPTPQQPVTLPLAPGPLAQGQLPPHALHSVFKETEFQEIALTIVGNWKHLGLRLGISYSRLQALETQHADQLLAVRAMFNTWQQQEGPSATRTALKDALIHIGYGKVARTLFGN